VPYREVSFPATSRLRSAAADALWYPRLRVDGVDLLHCPTFRGPFAPKVPLVVTVHDLGVLREPSWFNRWTRTYSRFAVPRVVRAAARLIAVSEFTKRELVDLLDVEEARIRVVPNAVADVFTPDGPRAEGDYVLAVGTLEPRKNLARVAAAVEGELRVVGARGWGGIEPPRDVTWLGEVSDDELARLYRGAAAVVYPSRFEGFGMPVTEAMASGAPVVASSHPSLDDACGDAAVRADPESAEAIAAAILEALERPDELRTKGFAHAARFSWRRTGKLFLEGYRRYS
jgi:glycosyltransferase involved in cell wall biosynthesis